MRYNMLYGSAEANGNARSVSTSSNDVYRPRKSFSDIGWNSFFRIGRGFLDSIAGAVGVPLRQLRQDYRNNGVDPDRFEANVSRELVKGGFGPLSSLDVPPDDLNEYMYEAEQKSQTPKANMVLIGLAAVMFFLMLKR